MSKINISCICGSSGREIEYRVTDENCFQHGNEWSSYEKVKDEPLRIRLAWRRFWRCSYLSTEVAEIDWWAQAFAEEAKEEGDDV